MLIQVFVHGLVGFVLVFLISQALIVRHRASNRLWFRDVSDSLSGLMDEGVGFAYCTLGVQADGGSISPEVRAVADTHAPAWLRPPEIAFNKYLSGYVLSGHAAGWPALAFKNETRTTVYQSASSTSASGYLAVGPLQFAIRPIWPGLLLDLLVWGTLSFVLWTYPKKIIRDQIARSRRRRGACIACGYQRDGIAEDLPCPECGDTPTSS